jgi:hypothetical protein
MGNTLDSGKEKKYIQISRREKSNDKSVKSIKALAMENAS